MLYQSTYAILSRLKSAYVCKFSIFLEDAELIRKSQPRFVCVCVCVCALPRMVLAFS